MSLLVSSDHIECCRCYEHRQMLAEYDCRPADREIQLQG